MSAPLASYSGELRLFPGRTSIGQRPASRPSWPTASPKVRRILLLANQLASHWLPAAHRGGPASQWTRRTSLPFRARQASEGHPNSPNIWRRRTAVAEKAPKLGHNLAETLSFSLVGRLSWAPVVQFIEARNSRHRGPTWLAETPSLCAGAALEFPQARRLRQSSSGPLACTQLAR